MSSITTWTRLEPRSRTDDMKPSLEGRVFDPAWLLGRQWQVGEFVGDDAGSPVVGEVQVLSNSFAAYQSGTAQPAVYGQLPLDAQAGPEPRGTMTAFESGEAGAQLVILLASYGCSATGIADLIGQHPLGAPPPGITDSQGASFLGVLTGRLPDAVRLEPIVRQAVATGIVPPSVGIPSSDNNAFLSAAKDWVGWLDGLILRAAGDGDAWIDASLDHRFTIGVSQPSGNPIAIVASSWDGERFDWYDVDVDPTVTAPSASNPLLKGTVASQASGLSTVNGPPVPLSYPGMPPHRWWQFDEGHVNFAQIAAAKDDLARMLVVEFASIYSNDWYLWPVRLPVNALHTVQSLRVTNTFGETTSIGPAGSGTGISVAGDWCIFRCAVRGQSQPSAFSGLLLPAALADEQRSSVLEEVILLRDEIAELAWAIEGTVAGADSRALDRHSASVADPAQSPPRNTGSSSDSSPLQYQLASKVPAYWFPLAPDQSGKPLFNRLLIGGIQPWGTILRPGQSLTIRQEEVPREGAVVRRNYHLVRGVDGAVLVWVGRTKSAGRGEGSSALCYDSAIG